MIVDIDGIWVEELLPAAFEGASYVYDGDGSLVKSEVNGVVVNKGFSSLQSGSPG